MADEGFDLSTASPIQSDDSGGFDLSTATPMQATEPKPSDDSGFDLSTAAPAADQYPDQVSRAAQTGGITPETKTPTPEPGFFSGLGSAVSDIPTQLRAGVENEPKRIAGNALQWFGTDSLIKKGKEWVDSSASDTELQPKSEGYGIAAQAVQGTARMVPALTALAAAAVWAPAVAGATTLGAAFAWAADMAQGSKEKSLQAGATPAQAEAVGDIAFFLGSATGAILPKIMQIVRPVAPELMPSAAGILESAVAPTMKDALVAIGQRTAGSAATLGGMSAGIAAAEKYIGGADSDPVHEAAVGALMGVFLHAPSAGIGAHDAALRDQAAAKLKQAFDDPNTPVPIRSAGAASVGARIMAADPEAARNFMERAADAINDRTPIDYGTDALTQPPNSVFSGAFDNAPADTGSSPHDVSQQPEAVVAPVTERTDSVARDEAPGAPVVAGEQPTASQIKIDPADIQGSIERIAAAPVTPVGLDHISKPAEGVAPEAHASAAGDLAALALELHALKESLVTTPKADVAGRAEIESKIDALATQLKAQPADSGVANLAAQVFHANKGDVTVPIGERNGDNQLRKPEPTDGLSGGAGNGAVEPANPARDQSGTRSQITEAAAVPGKPALAGDSERAQVEAPHPAVIASFRDAANGVEARVAKRDDGQFAVTVHDTDAGQTVGQVIVYPNRDAAIAKAQSIAEGKPIAAAPPKSEITVPVAKREAPKQEVLIPDATVPIKEREPEHPHAPAMRGEIGWAQRGGELIRQTSGFTSSDLDSAGNPLIGAGAVIGRTKWVAKSDFWQGRPDKGLSERDAHLALDLAERGEKMTPKQQRFVQYADAVMKDRLAAEAEAQRETDLEREAIQSEGASQPVAEVARDMVDDTMGRRMTDAEVEEFLAGTPSSDVARGSSKGEEHIPQSHEGAADFSLASESEADIAKREKSLADAKAKEEDDARAAERKAAADRERDSFNLSGSNRTADEAAARGQKPLLSRDVDKADLSTVPLTEARAVQAIADHISEHWKNGPKINVVQGVRELPFAKSKDVQASAKRGGRIQGAFWQGEVWIVADNVHLKDVPFVIGHEAFGHYGLAGFLGDERVPTMNQIYATNPNVRTIADSKVKTLGYDKALATEEAISDMAGRGDYKQIRGWQALFAKIRDAMRKLGFNVKFSDDDVAALLANARKHVEGEDEGGKQTSGEGDPLYSYHLYDDLERPEKKSTGVLDSIQKAVAPASRGPIAERQAGIMRDMLAMQARSNIVAEQRFRDHAAFMSKMDTSETRQWIDRFEKGQQQPTQELRDIDHDVRSLNADNLAMVHDINPEMLKDFNENYLGRIWKDKKGASAFFAKRPLEGGKGFLKQRTFEYFRDGINAGFEPITENPIEMMLIKSAELKRFVYAQKIFGEMKDAGLAKFVKFGGEAPEGWTKINDKIARVLQKNEGEGGGMILRGEYYAPDEAATLINNHLSPGLQGNGAYDIVRNAGNLLNSVQLGLSAYHLGFTTFDSMVSKAALGAQQLSRGQIIKGTGNVLQSLNPAQPFMNLYKGDKLLRAYLGKLNDPRMQPIVDALLKGGGRVKLDDFYRNASVNAFSQALKRYDVPGTAKHLIPWALDKINAPIFEYIVPRQKLGVFFDLAHDWIERNPGASTERTRAAMGQFWDSVDNRLGQIVYDNVFWKRTHKDALMISVRSVGWNLGTFRELGGGVGDIRKIIKNKEASSRLGYVIALPFVSAVYGALIGALYGQPPKELKDYFFPRTGKKRPDGSEDRVSLPSYMKDIYAYGHDIHGFAKFGGDPTATLANKLHPLLSTMHQMVSNADFFGGAIRSPGDPLMVQLQDEAKFLLKQLTPFGVRNYQQQQKLQNKEATVAGYLTAPPIVGITPAAAHITKSDAQLESAAASHMRDSLMMKFREEIQDGAKIDPLVRRMVAAGLRPAEIGQVIKNGLTTLHPQKGLRTFGFPAN